MNMGWPEHGMLSPRDVSSIEAAHGAAVRSRAVDARATKNTRKRLARTLPVHCFAFLVL